MKRTKSRIDFERLVHRRRIVNRSLHVALVTGAVIIIPVGMIDDDAGTAVWIVLLVVAAVGPLLAHALLKRQPTYVLLFRPFGEPAVTYSLRQLVRRELSFLGFTLTLADAHMRPSSEKGWEILSRIGGLATAVFSPLPMRAIVRSDLDYLRGSLQSRRRMTIRWVWSIHRLFVVLAANTLWRDAIGVLMENADLVVVDLSHAGPGSVWELERLRNSSVSTRIVFVTLNEHLQIARDLVAGFFPYRQECLFGYRNDGSLVRREEFMALLARWF